MIVRKHKSDLVILFATLGLMALGLIVIYAIGPMRANVMNNAYGENHSPNEFFIGQLISVAISLVALFFAFRVIPYSFLRRHSRLILILALALCLLLYISSDHMLNLPIAKCELGQCRWLNLPGGRSFQPAEFLKLALIIYLADFLSRAQESGVVGKIKEFWVPLGVVFALSMFFVVIAQGDLGTGVAIIAIFFGTILISGVPLRQYLLMVAFVIVVAVLSTVTSAHRMERIDAWIATIQGKESESTYHVENAIMAIGTGGLFGVGIGNSVQATGYLPESINDSVFAIMGETFGFIGLFLIIAVFAIILWRMLRAAKGTPSPSDCLLVVGVFSWTLAQVAVNIMAMTSIVPVTGITLPLLSYGGTSMMFISFAIGLVLQISCYTSREGTNHENISSGRRVRGSYHPSRRRDSRNPKRPSSRRG